MLEKTLAAVAGVITLAAVIFVAVGALAFALFSALAGPLGPPGAAAIVAGLFALIAGVAIAIVAMQNDKPRDRDGDGIPDFSMIERIIGIAKDRPILSIGAAIAAGLIAIRNPALVATIVAAFIDRPKGR